MNNKLEIIAQNVLDAINSQKGGADRVELISALSQGGLTPSIGMIKSVLNSVDIEVAIMVRPTSDTFAYEKHYLDVMKQDIQTIDKLEGNKRVVLGILDKDLDIDFEALNYVLEDIKTPITFHRAIDESRDILESVKKLNGYDKVTHILTSGTTGKAQEHIQILSQMIQMSNKKIMIGSGITSNSIEIIKNAIPLSKDYDIHVGSFVQGDDGIVDIKKVRQIHNLVR